MSAFMVSKAHVDLIVQAAIAGTSEHGRLRSEPFNWYADGERHVLEIGCEPDQRSYGAAVRDEHILGELLVRENVRSVEGRYPDTNGDRGDLPGPLDAYYMGPYVFEPYRRSGQRLCVAGMPEAICAPCSAGELAKAIRCYEYQSCEHAEWESSQAHAICEALLSECVEALPGYGSAPWGVDERVSA